MELSAFIVEHASDDVNRLALKRNRYPEMTDTDFSFALQQIDGRQRTRNKLPFLQQNAEWWFPRQLSLEQCSSEATARYKQKLVFPQGENNQGESNGKLTGSVLVDLTGGMGIDTLFLSEVFGKTHYVEQNEELCLLAEHNFGSALPSGKSGNIEVHHDTAEHFLQTLTHADIIYIDPARRSKSGSKVFRLEDCEPNLLQLLPLMRQKASAILMKLSPMLDIAAAVRLLAQEHACHLQVHVVAIRNEVKEVLIYMPLQSAGEEALGENLVDISCVNLQTEQEPFKFTTAEERDAECGYATQLGNYIIEPNMAIMKAGAFKTFAQRYNLLKLAKNTHLYTCSDDRATILSECMPARVWKITDIADKHSLKGRQLNILSRNHPLSADQIRQKYSIRDGGNQWLIATRIADKAIMLMAN